MTHQAVVILAGGEGTRIGGGKPLRRVAGRSLIHRALDHARSWSPIIGVAVRDPAQVGEIGDAALLIDRGAAGPIGGLAAALDFAQEQGAAAVLTIPCDTPLLPDDLLARLGATSAPAAMPVSGGQLHPACTLWSVSARAMLPGYLASGRGSLTGFAEFVGHAAVEWGIEPHDPFLNVNAPKDLELAERLLRERG